jgi:hypothetical protein
MLARTYRAGFADERVRALQREIGGIRKTSTRISCDCPVI